MILFASPFACKDLQSELSTTRKAFNLFPEPTSSQMQRFRSQDY